MKPAGEKTGLGVKILKKVPVKNVFAPMKKKKRKKTRFTGTFDFHGKKKKRWIRAPFPRLVDQDRDRLTIISTD